MPAIYDPLHIHWCLLGDVSESIFSSYSGDSWWCLSAENRHLTVNFRHTNMVAIKCKSWVLVKAAQGHLATLISWLPRCTDAGDWWVWTRWNVSNPGTSRPPRGSTSVRIKALVSWIGQEDPVGRPAPACRVQHEKTENVPNIWLLLPMGL